MNTRVVAVEPESPDAGTIAKAAAVLRAGGLVAFPTETVYGLGANALDPAAVARIYSAKERAADDPLIVHVLGPGDLDAITTGIPAAARALAEAAWPGPLTIIFERGPALAPAVSGGGSTVAVRAPAHPVARALIAAARLPIAAPSANRFMRTSATTARHVLEDLDGRIDLVLDGGPAPGGIESTVVAFSTGAAVLRILRHGAVTREDLELLCPGVAIEERPGAGQGASPGTALRHYAPRTPLVLVEGSQEDTWERAVALAKDELAAGRRPALLVFDGEACPDGALSASLGPGDAVEAGRRLFAALRAMDAAGATVILARSFPEAGLGAALNDRLRRAAERVDSAGE